MADELVIDDSVPDTPEVPDEFDIPVGRADRDRAAGKGEPAADPKEAADKPVDDKAAPVAPKEEPVDPNAPSPELLQRLTSTGLRPIPGETATAAQDRLFNHLVAKSSANYREVQKEKERSRALEAHMATLSQQLEPIVREHYQRQKEQQTAELAAAMPDKYAQPQEYAIWLQEENLRYNIQRDDEQKRQQEQWAEQQRSALATAQLEQLDGTAFNLVYEAIEQDEEIARAYDIQSQLMRDNFSLHFPDAEEAQLAELVALTQQLEYRKWLSQNRHPAEVLREQYRKWRRYAGVKDEAPNEEIGAAATVVAAPQVSTPQPSPTATRMQQEAEAARRRGPVSAPVPTRPVGNTELPEVGDMDEDEYLEAVLRGQFTEEQRIGKHRKFR